MNQALRKRWPWLLFILLIFVGILMGATLRWRRLAIYNLQQGSLQQSRQRWINQNTRNYRYNVRIGCFKCVDPFIYVVEVRNGSVTSILALEESGRNYPVNYLDRFAPVEKMFDQVQTSIRRRVDTLSVSYDP